MGKKLSKNQRRLKVHLRVRGKLSGSAERPRLAVFRSLKHFYAQLIDDEKGVTLGSASTLGMGDLKNQSNVVAAEAVGQRIAEVATGQGIESVVFDRAGYIYHGRVKACAESARKHGLKF